MFYLIQFFKFIRIKGAPGHLFLFFSLALIVSSLTYFPINQAIRQRFHVESPLPYFHALILGNSEIAAIVNKLNNTPGVAKIETKMASHLQRQARDLLNDLGLHELYQNETYRGLQIFLGPGHREQTYLLVRDYMAHLLGHSNVSFSPLKSPKTTMLNTKKASIQFLYRWGHPSLLFVMGLLWSLSLLGIGRDFQKYCYLIEEYQRRKNISFKVMMVGLLTLIALSVATFIFLGNIHFYSIAGTAVFMMIFASLFCLQKRWS